MPNQAELYNRVNTYQHNSGLELMEMANPQPDEKVLDIGSGTGNLTFELARRVLPNGQVFAIEPDTDRLQVAKQNQPVTLNNIIWNGIEFEKFKAPKEEMFNLAYTNYVFHWIKDQKAAIQKVYDNLIPGGRFAFCCVFGMPQVARDLCQAAGTDGDKLLSQLHFISKSEWLDLFKSIGFKIVMIDEVPDYEFNNIEEVMTWWQGTSHGVFLTEKLSDSAKNALKNKYPGKINIYRNETLRLIALK